MLTPFDTRVLKSSVIVVPPLARNSELHLDRKASATPMAMPALLSKRRAAIVQETVSNACLTFESGPHVQQFDPVLHRHLGLTAEMQLAADIRRNYTLRVVTG